MSLSRSLNDVENGRRWKEEAYLDVLHKVVHVAINMRRKFGDEYEGRFLELDEAIAAWAAYNDS